MDPQQIDVTLEVFRRGVVVAVVAVLQFAAVAAFVYAVAMALLRGRQS